MPVWPGMFEYDRWPVSVKPRRRATSWPGATVASSRASDAVEDLAFIFCDVFFISVPWLWPWDARIFFPLFPFSAAAVCIGIGPSKTDPALLSLPLNDFFRLHQKNFPPPRHLFALPPKGYIDTYWLNLIFINNRMWYISDFPSRCFFPPSVIDFHPDMNVLRLLVRTIRPSEKFGRFLKAPLVHTDLRVGDICDCLWEYTERAIKSKLTPSIQDGCMQDFKIIHNIKDAQCVIFVLIYH